MFHGQDRIYAYAIGILVGTLVQLLIPAWDLRHTPSASLELRLAPPGRAAGAGADAAGDDQPRADQLQPADQQLLRQPGLRRRRRRRSTKPSASTSCRRGSSRWRSRRSSSRPWRGSPTRGEIDNLRATMANGMRQILFVLVPAAAAILALSDPMIRLVYQRGEFDPAETPRRDGALLVRLLAADQRPLPAADADLLQPAAALAGDRAGDDRPRRLGPRGAGALQAVRGRRHRRRDGDRDHGRGDRPGGDPAPRVRRAGAAAAVLDGAADHDRRGGAGRGRLASSGTCSTRRSDAAWWARSSPSARPRRRRPRLRRGRQAAAGRGAGADHPPAAGRR